MSIKTNLGRRRFLKVAACCAALAKANPSPEQERRRRTLVKYANKHNLASLAYTHLKVAAISMKTQNWDKDANMAKLEKLFRMATDLGSQVAVAPETAIQGFLPAVVYKNPELVNRFVQAAEPIDGPSVRRFGELAKALGICLCFGFLERIDDDVYNTAVFLDQQGRLCGRHQKLDDHGEKDHPDVRYRSGKQIRAFDTPYGKAGMLICADRWNPLIARTLTLDGAQVIYVPSEGGNDSVQDCAVVTRSRENGVPIVQANFAENLIVSRGEIVAHETGDDRVTMATIEIPQPASPERARKMEQLYLEWQAKYAPVSGPSTWGYADRRWIENTTTHLFLDPCDRTKVVGVH